MFRWYFGHFFGFMNILVKSAVTTNCTCNFKSANMRDACNFKVNNILAFKIVLIIF